MKTKKGILITIIIVVLLVIVGIIILSLKNNVQTVQEKGFEIFGSDYCDGKHNEFGGDALTSWTCSLCGKSDVNPDTATPAICNDCAIVTGRCMSCGKLEK